MKRLDINKNINSLKAGRFVGVRRGVKAGFTAVELLVTLFVAGAFLIAGYQLFNVVINSGGEARAKSSATNIAYSYMRQYSDSATNPCSSLSPLVDQPISVGGLSDVTVTVTIACIQDDAPSLSKIDVTVKYNKPQETVNYATYVDRSSGASASDDVTDGLIGWWKLNGNTNTSVGSAHGIAHGALPTTGQNGEINSAYIFSGTCCNYITTASTMPPLIRPATFSAWIYPTAAPADKAAIIVNNPINAVNGFYLSLSSDRSLQTYWYGSSPAGYHSSGASTIPLNTWTLVVAVWDTTQVKLYVNSTLKTTVSSTFSVAPISGYSVDIGAESYDSIRQFTGSIDDVRIYDRALSGSEVTQLYNNGAK